MHRWKIGRLSVCRPQNDILLTVLKERMAKRLAIIVLKPGARQDCAMKPSFSSARQITSSPRFQSHDGMFNRQAYNVKSYQSYYYPTVYPFFLVIAFVNANGSLVVIIELFYVGNIELFQQFQNLVFHLICIDNHIFRIKYTRRAINFEICNM